MKTNRRSHEKGAGLVEYALIVMLISVIASVSIAIVGEDVSTAFESTTVSADGTTATTQPQTPDEKWEQAQADYDSALAKAKDDKASELAAARNVYDQAVTANKSLPKADKKAANQAAQAQHNDSKAAANANYKNSVDAANTAKAVAKAEWKATK